MSLFRAYIAANAGSDQKYGVHVLSIPPITLWRIPPQKGEYTYEL